MSTATPLSDYVLGSSNTEHERLIRQARTLAPLTERLFRDAGVSTGNRALDVGSGVGDVAFLAAALVGPAGSVLGVDRDSVSLARARARAATEHATTVRFVETDVATLGGLRHEGEFDAIVGRFILMFLPDPAATVRALAAHLRPGGIIVFQEPSWASFFPQARHLPLRTACGELVCEVLRRAGARANMELTLYRGMIASRLTSPQLRVEVPIASDVDGRRWIHDLLVTLRPRIEQYGIPSDGIGDFDTLAARLEAELQAVDSYAPMVGLVGAWARRVR